MGKFDRKIKLSQIANYEAITVSGKTKLASSTAKNKIIFNASRIDQGGGESSFSNFYFFIWPSFLATVQMLLYCKIRAHQVVNGLRARLVIFTSDFESHWVPHQIKMLSKLLLHCKVSFNSI